MLKKLTLRDRKETEIDSTYWRITKTDEDRALYQQEVEKQLKSYYEWLEKNGLEGVKYRPTT